MTERNEQSVEHLQLKLDFNLEDLLLFPFFARRTQCQTLRKAKLGLWLRVRLRLKLPFGCAGGADILLPFLLHLTTLCLTDTNAVAMEPFLATVTADHEPRGANEQIQVMRKWDWQMVQVCKPLKVQLRLKDLVTKSGDVPFVVFLSADAVQSIGVITFTVRYAWILCYVCIIFLLLWGIIILARSYISNLV